VEKPRGSALRYRFSAVKQNWLEMQVTAGKALRILELRCGENQA
jgi:hypothetical protein